MLAAAFASTSVWENTLFAGDAAIGRSVFSSGTMYPTCGRSVET